MTQVSVARCVCGTDLAPSIVTCPGCNRLVHAERLNQLANSAVQFESSGYLRDALVDLREALELLPKETVQHRELHRRYSDVSDRIDAGEGLESDSSKSEPPDKNEKAKPRWKKWGGALGAAGFLVWKLKFVAVFVATKAKLLFLGLGKSTTLFSMLVSFGAYWTLWGWKFALGVVLSIYVHEMGHVTAMKRFGIRVSAPMFLPGIGAIVRMKSMPQTRREDARIGLAGPIWGLGAALLVACAYWLTGLASLAAIASVGAWINLFNLAAIWQLDGGRAFRALSTGGRWLVLATAGGVGVVTHEGLFALIGIAAGLQIMSGSKIAKSDRRTLVEFVLLLICLGALATLSPATL